MRLYPKKLHSIEELKREKAALLLRRDATDVEDIFSINDIIPVFGKKDKPVKDNGADKTEKENVVDTGDGIFSILSDLLETVDISDIFTIVSRPLEAFAGKKIRNSILMPVAKELVGGYLKWKAAELSFKTAKHFMKKKKEKKNKEYNEE